MSVSGGSHDGLVAAAFDIRAEEQALNAPAGPAVTSGSDADPPSLVALADRIADRVAQRLVLRIAQLVDPNSQSVPASGTLQRLKTEDDAQELWTVRQVAARYGVTQSFIYQHADELGCIRLGGGRCPRLRFDRRVVRERWPMVGEPSSPFPRSRPRSASRRRASARRRDRDFELLDFDRDP